MAKGKTRTPTRTGGRRDSGESYPGPINNQRIPMPAAIEKMVRARQEQARQVCRDEAELYAAASLSPEERVRRDAALTEITRKLGILDESKALREIARARAQRLGKVLAKARKPGTLKGG